MASLFMFFSKLLSLKMDEQEEYILFSIDDKLKEDTDKSKKNPSYKIEKDLQEFLEKLQLLHLENLCIKNEITMEEIKKFSDEDLTIIGVTKYSERKRIRTAIKQIQLGSSFYHTSKDTLDNLLTQDKNFNPKTL